MNRKTVKLENLKDNLDDEKQAFLQELKSRKSFQGLDDKMLRLKRNTLIVSVIALFYKLSREEITGFSPLGIMFDSTDTLSLDILLFSIIAYHCYYFSWNSAMVMYEDLLQNILEKHFKPTGISAHNAIPHTPETRLYDDYKIDAEKILEKVNKARARVCLCAELTLPLILAFLAMLVILFDIYKKIIINA